MRKFWLVIAVMLLAVAMGTSGALATYMELEVNSAWSFAFTGPGTFTLAPYYNYAYVSGYSQAPADSKSGSDSTLGGASVLINSSPNLLHQEANNVSTPPPPFNAHTHLIGTGPQAISMSNGYLSQYAYEYMAWTFSPTVTGFYNITALNAGNVHFIGDNSAGQPAYYVSQNVSYFLNLSGGGKYLQNTGNTSYQDSITPPGPVDVWDFVNAGPFTLGITNVKLTAGTTYYLQVADQADQYMETTGVVPLPPSALLLGSGLLGLGLLRRKWSLKK